MPLSRLKCCFSVLLMVLGCAPGAEEDLAGMPTRGDQAVTEYRTSLSASPDVQSALEGEYEQARDAADPHPDKGHTLKFLNLKVRLDGSTYVEELAGDTFNGKLKGMTNRDGYWFAQICLASGDCENEELWGYKPAGAFDSNLPIPGNDRYAVFSNYLYPEIFAITTELSSTSIHKRPRLPPGMWWVD